MIERTYKCNLCHGEIDSDTGFGFVWKEVGRMNYTGLLGSENHICFPCGRAVQALLRDMDFSPNCNTKGGE